MKQALLIAIALLLVGCGTTVPVDLTASAARDVTFEPFQKFAVIHGTTGNSYSRQIARETANAVQNLARREDYTLLTGQQPLVTSAEATEAVRGLAAMARQSFAQAGYSHDGRDPDIAVRLEFATGPFDYHVPLRSFEDRPGVLAHPGPLYRAYAHGVLMHVYDAHAHDQPIWVGYAVTINDVADFTKVAPALIDELVRAYPAATPPVRRNVTLR